ncbi:MAG: HAD-IIIA family hydrolase [Desulfobulbaceae bacterium]|nr:HAD-IIIA family hydrolase [Desulfobulbaceae bacterium]
MSKEACGATGSGYPSDCEVTEGLRRLAAGRVAAGQRSYSWRTNLERARAIKLLLLDVDGVLTDGSIIYTPDGQEIKAFNTRDGLGLRLVQKAGIQVGLITARTSEVVKRRAENLGISMVYQGAGKKLEVFRRILAEQKLAPIQVAYVGDDWLDLPLLTRVGLAVAVADGAEEVRAVAHYVTELPGGRGAVREVCELLIEAQGRSEALLAEYLEHES